MVDGYSRRADMSGRRSRETGTGTRYRQNGETFEGRIAPDPADAGETFL